MEIKNISVNELKPFKKNNKQHPQKQVQMIADSIKQFGFKNPIIIDKNNEIIAWHGRLLWAKQLGMETVPCIIADDLSEEQVRAYRLLDNRIGDFGEYDIESIMDELKDIGDMQLWLDSLDDLFTGIVPKTKKEEIEEIEDDVPEVREEKDIDVKFWDLFEIGDHRLLCWDSTDESNVKKLIGDHEGILHCISDPPYWISYDNWNHWMIMNDDVILDYVWLAQKYTNGYFCMWTGYQVVDIRKQLIQKYFKKINNMIIRHKWWWWLWDCERTLAQDFEILLVVNRWNYIQSDRGGAFRNRNKEEKQERLKKAKKEEITDLLEKLIDWTVTWKVKKDWNLQYSHPTQKPVEINDRVLINFTKEWDWVLDLFWWSWSNMASCYKNDRKCMMMELDPKYCQVIIDRMIKLDPTLEIKKNWLSYNPLNNG